MPKPLKRWSVNAVSKANASLSLFCDDRPVRHGAEGFDSLSPIQYFLISIASCFALSCRAELNRRKLRGVSFEVVVLGDKERGATADNLLCAISIVSIFDGSVAESLAKKITARAKPLCTVTNTLRDSPTIRFKSQALLRPRTPSQERPAQLSPY